jgi:hypothetical protein
MERTALVNRDTDLIEFSVWAQDQKRLYPRERRRAREQALADRRCLGHHRSPLVGRQIRTYEQFDHIRALRLVGSRSLNSGGR